MSSYAITTSLDTRVFICLALLVVMMFWREAHTFKAEDPPKKGKQETASRGEAVLPDEEVIPGEATLVRSVHEEEFDGRSPYRGKGSKLP
jgi:hypothetical protein